MPKDFATFIDKKSIQTIEDLYEEKTLHELLTRFGDRFGFLVDPKQCAKKQLHQFLGYAHSDTDEVAELYGKVALANILNAKDFAPEPLEATQSLLIRASMSQFEHYESEWRTLLARGNTQFLTLAGDHWTIMQDPKLAHQLATVVANSDAFEEVMHQ